MRKSVQPVNVYLCIPIQFCKESYVIEETLQKFGINVLNPCRITPEEMAVSKEQIPKAVAMKCWTMINASSAFVLYADYYGRDCAAEIGYAIAQNKAIFPYTRTGQTPFLESDWMVKSFLEQPSPDLHDISQRIVKYVRNAERGLYIRQHFANS